MRRHLYILFLILIGCVEYEIPQTYFLTIKAKYPSSIENGRHISNTNIVLKNKQTGREYYEKLNEQGEAFFQIRGGVYDAVISFAEEHFIEVDGNSTIKNLQFSGAIRGQTILKNNLKLELKTEYSILNTGFVIKEMYISGSRTDEGQLYFRDSFIEIYNNTDKIMYSDGLCIGVVHETTTSRPTRWIDENGNLINEVPCFSCVAIIPGTGKEHPVEAGESILIANKGINHKDDPNGNPNSIDLSFADWEMFIDAYINIDSPNVPNMNMQIITHGNHFMSFDVRGQVCIVFRLPHNNLQEIFLNQDNYKMLPGGTRRAFMVPSEWVIDGVDNLQAGESVVYKRLLDKIDIGYIQHQGSGEKVSIKRKVKEVIEGRTVYLDTNNSTNDFLTNQEPTPGVIAKN